MRTIATLCALLVSTSAWGGSDLVPTSPPVPFSQDCQVGNAAVTSASPLPNVVAALQQRKQIKILAIGTSSSVRRGAKLGGHTEETRQILQDAIKGFDIQMIDRGVGGELSAQAVGRIQNEVALNRPDLVLWQVGTDDALAYVPLEELETTIVDAVRWLKGHNVDVVLVGLQYVEGMEQDENYRAVRELLRRVAAKENVMIVRRYEALRLLAKTPGSTVGLSDEFERNEAAYLCLAQYLARAITIGIFGDRSSVRPDNPKSPANRHPE